MLVEFEAGELVRNWHQTILSRAEYSHLYPAQDADGWIEWKSPFYGSMPCDEDAEVDIKVGDVIYFRYVAKCWKHWGSVTAYRLHKPEQAKTVGADAIGVAESTPEAKPTIEQLAADYRNAKDYAERKQKEAEAAKADADEKLNALEEAGEAIGLLVSPIIAKQEPELVITDWRDFQVGDEVELLNRRGGKAKVGEIGVISKVLKGGDFYVDFPSQRGYSVEHVDIKFIRRP